VFGVEDIPILVEIAADSSNGSFKKKIKGG